MRAEHKSVLEEYASIKLQIRALEEKIDLLQPEVMAIVDESGVEELNIGDLGTLTKAFKRIWKYVPEIEAIKKQYDTARKEAEQTGVGASYTENAYLRFTSNKEE